jgi:Poly(3-hydroxybutyrate) depolymerase
MRKKTNAVLLALLATFMLLSFMSCSNGSTPTAEEAFEKSLEPVMNNTVNPEKPYDGICWGLFEKQQTVSEESPRGGDEGKITVHTEGQYAVYIPKGFQPKQKTVMILTPNNTTASEFAKSEIGRAWMKLSYERADFAVAFVEPLGGKTWNTALAAVTDATAGSPRDERAFIYDVTKNLKEKSYEEGRPFISVDKNAMSIIGYGEGADMAAVLAAAWPALFPNTLLINPTMIETETIETLLAEGAYPHIVDKTLNWGKVNNGQIGMPVYVYSGDAAIKAEVKRIWDGVNRNAVNPDSSLDKNLLAVTELSSDNVSDIYAAAANNNRFMGYSGGTVRERVDFTSDNFEFHREEKVEGDLMRRWSIYTPDNFDTSQKNPLVVVLHGSSASITDIAEETRWTDIADKEGFAVLFIQGYPKASSAAKNPFPSWILGSAKTPDNYKLEKNIDLQYIDQVVTRVVEERNIDEERIYITGHSLGSMMTITVMGSEIANRFAAFGPIGAFSLPNTEAPVKDVAIWAMLGEFEGARYGTSIDAWGPVLGLDVTNKELADEGGDLPEGKYMSVTYNNTDGEPRMKFTMVMDSPHTYMAEEADLLWYDYFSHYRRVDGATVYTK